MTAATNLIKLLFAYFTDAYPLPDAVYEYTFDSPPPNLPRLSAKFVIYCNIKGPLTRLESYLTPLIF